MQSNNRKDVIKNSGLETSLIYTGLISCKNQEDSCEEIKLERSRVQLFNMSGGAAPWSSISPLSEWSVANRSNSIDVSDFTCGSWKHNTPVSLSLEGGATTKARNLGSADSSEQLRI